ncbi:5-bromo-4-chloroindolyl phosphate hydrolysis family protein [Lysinibacillus sp. KU-BSD001]|uniref:5-bromo-4-chloroindolyl phosphate hydrolysis family protein n=1 Tax=Lysinibacillus sp. KU-BSD001 TaxID=3141328 RepID=UPI0036E14543
MHFITRHAFNFFISSALLILSIVNFDIGLFGLAVLIGGYYMSNKLILAIQKRKRRKELGMTKEEYRHIEEQIKLAREQLTNLTQQYVRVRSIKSFKLLNETNKVAKRIINIVHTNPQKFYAVEDFFYAHLPSAVELADKYTLLTKEQVKGTDIHIALEDTRKTLKDLHGTIENDLKLALQSDIDQLKIELDFAKLANEQSREKIGGGGE